MKKSKRTNVKLPGTFPVGEKKENTLVRNSVRETRPPEKPMMVNFGGHFFDVKKSEQEAKQKSEKLDTLPLILIDSYQAFNKLGPEHQYMDLVAYLDRFHGDNEKTWYFVERMVLALTNTWKKHEASLYKRK